MAVGWAHSSSLTPGHLAYKCLWIPRDGDQRSELLSVTILTWVRVLDGVADPLRGSRKNLLSARNEINQIAEIWNKDNWLPSLDTFRTFVIQLAV